jgi:hypothetical protein|tara:strand:- start:1150 stop:1269 length:120 start_codon:yes stop_codon:yes gene_type:complete
MSGLCFLHLRNAQSHSWERYAEQEIVYEAFTERKKLLAD